MPKRVKMEFCCVQKCRASIECARDAFSEGNIIKNPLTISNRRKRAVIGVWLPIKDNYKVDEQYLSIEIAIIRSVGKRRGADVLSIEKVQVAHLVWFTM